LHDFQRILACHDPERLILHKDGLALIRLDHVARIQMTLLTLFQEQLCICSSGQDHAIDLTLDHASSDGDDPPDTEAGLAQFDWGSDQNAQVTNGLQVGWRQEFRMVKKRGHK
jgi:hypothetical protein